MSIPICLPGQNFENTEQRDEYIEENEEAMRLRRLDTVIVFNPTEAFERSPQWRLIEFHEAFAGQARATPRAPPPHRHTSSASTAAAFNCS